MDWVHLALTGALYVGGAVTLALLGLLIVRRYVSHHVLAQHNDVAGFIYATIAVTYAVILGFVTITVWEAYEEARSNADHEANVVADLYRLADWFPETDREAIQAMLTAYATSVIEEEWDAMDRGEAPAASTSDSLDRLWEFYAGLDPGAGGQAVAYSDSMDRLQDLGDARRMRLLESEVGIPGIMWVGLIAGGAITVAFAYGFGVERGQSHGVMLATLAASVALLLFMVSSLNYAFHGDVRVQPDGMELVLSQFNTR
jgi:hypothetical protein